MNIEKVGAGGRGAPPPPPPPTPTFLLLFAKCPRALTPLGLKETETTATQVIHLIAKLAHVGNKMSFDKYFFSE